jgi:DNA-binding response OmpR family regulator
MGVVERQVRVLVIEDDEDSRALFKEILTESGIEATCADHDALPDPDGFTVVVSDLPRTRTRYSSSCACDWVEALARRYLVPVIVMTGRSEAVHDDRLRRAAAFVMPKPIDVSEFIAIVRKADGVMRPD